MERLTTNKDVSEMGMYELAHNCCYCKDSIARYRDFENDIDARDLARELAWSLADIELSSYDDNFDEENYRLVGEQHGRVFRLGEPVRVRVRNAEPANRTIDFTYVEKETETE